MKMDTKSFINFIPKYFKRLEDDGFSKDAVDVCQWIINHFKKYCLVNQIEQIDMQAVEKFYLNQYDIDIYNLACIRQGTLRKPLLTFMELYETDTYYKNHQKETMYQLTDIYSSIILMYQTEYLCKSNLARTTQQGYIVRLKDFLVYLESERIFDINQLKIVDISNYFNSLKESYSDSTLRTTKGNLRIILDWMYDKKLVSFSGRVAIPELKNADRNRVLSSYSIEEIKKMLNCLNTKTPSGKEMYLVISLATYLGLRAYDIVNLRFDQINWEKNQIHIIQHKTKRMLILPLCDEVKFPLIDYIKDGRHKSRDEDYILTTFKAPYTKFSSSTSIYRIVTEVMDIAGIDYSEKHHGPHALRHSLATNMINSNAPISAISSILGHSSTRVTDIYITKDITHLRELTLDVPYAF